MTEEQNNQQVQPEQESNSPAPLNDVDKIRQMTGEETMESEVSSIPFLKFNGDPKDPNGGKFLLSTGQKDEEGNNLYEELGTTIKGVILRVRKKLQTGLDDKIKKTSEEFDGLNENDVTLYDAQGNEETRTSVPTLRNKYPNLKIVNILYVYLIDRDQIYKMFVSSGSFRPLTEYLSSFKDAKTGQKDTVLRYETIFSSQDAYGSNNRPYKQMTFAKGEVVGNWEPIWAKLQETNDIIQRTAQKNQEVLPKEGEYSQEPTTPQNNTTQSSTNKEIDVDNISFT